MEGDVKSSRIKKLYSLLKNSLFNKKKIEQYKDKIDNYRYEKLLDVFSLYYTTKDGSDISENYFINNIISFRTKRAQDIMIPRVDIIATDGESDIDEVLKTMDKSGFSRIPVFKDNLDDVIGFIHIKDLIPFIKKKSKINLPKMVRSVLFISP